jgi:uncharacterized membrane protein
MLEYVGSYFIEALSCIIPWNYSWDKYNINGRICLQFSSLWGICIVIFAKLVHPFVSKEVDKYIINKIPIKVIRILMFIICLVLLCDFISALTIVRPQLV